MYICEKCNKEVKVEFGSGRFCSRPCANSRVKSKETKEKTSKSLRRFCNENPNRHKDYKDYKPRSNTILTVEEYEVWITKLRKTREINLLNKEFSKIAKSALKKRISLEQEKSCGHCGLDIWRDIPITLELDHVSGDREDNSRENLICLCPNCHSQTDTWRGRNKKVGSKFTMRGKVSDEEICKSFIECDNIRQCLMQVGLAPKGGNYGRVKRALTLAGIKY